MFEENQSAQVVSIQRRYTGEFFQISRAMPIRCEKGTKVPTQCSALSRQWRQEASGKPQMKLEEAEAILAGTDNVGMCYDGRIMDVDVDGDDSMLQRALDQFLPATPHVFGRGARKRTHRLYQVAKRGVYTDSEFPVLASMKSMGDFSVEVRGTAPSPEGTPHHSVLPGSELEDGSVYEWHKGGDVDQSMVELEPAYLIGQVRKAVAAAMLAGYWQEGMRNDLTLHLAGLLAWIYRSAMTDEALMTGEAGPMFLLDQKGARAFFEGVLELADDDPEDRGSRLKTFDHTWRKAEAGAPTTGGARLAELLGDTLVVQRLKILLADSSHLRLLEEYQQRYVVRNDGTLLNVHAMLSGQALFSLERSAARNAHDYETIVSADGKARNIIDLLYKARTTTRVDGITFIPGGPRFIERSHFANPNRHAEDERYQTLELNTWRGFGTTPHPSPVSEEEVAPFLEYLRGVIADGNLQLYQWVLQWLADIFQNPGDKPGTALVLVGKPGTGKSFLGSDFILPMIGQAHSATTDSVEDITGRFNARFQAKLYIQCEEAINSRQRAVAAKLKSLITDKFRRVEAKNVNAWEEPNHARMVFTSNEFNDALYIGDGRDDRRFTVLRVSDSHRQDLAYFGALSQWADLNRPKVMRYLLDLPIDTHLIRRPLDTQSKREMQQTSWNPIDTWLATMVQRGHPFTERAARYPWQFRDSRGRAPREDRVDMSYWPTYVHYDSLVEDYQTTFGRDRNAPAVPNAQVLARELRDRGLMHHIDKDESRAIIRARATTFDRDGTRKEMRVYLRQFPTDREIRDYIYVTFGIDVETMDDDGDEEPGTVENPDLEY